MRAFSIIYLFVFLAFYMFISYAAVKSFTEIIHNKQKRRIILLSSIFTLLYILFFVVLYIWPFNARSTTSYSWHLIYNALLTIDFVFKLPLTLSYLSGLFFLRNKKPVIQWIGFVISVCLSLSVFYGTILGRNQIVINKIELEFKNLPKDFDGYTIVQFSDTHLGSFIHSHKMMKKAINTFNELNPELVLFTGDLINNFASEMDGWEDLFQKISKDRVSIAILGNHDYGDYSSWSNEISKSDNFIDILEGHKNFGFHLLRNENVILKKGNDSIFIVGVENWGHPPFPQYAELDKAMLDIPNKSFVVLMTHDPAHWDSVVKNRKDIDLSLSGHTHGLQWGIKKAGITFSLSYLVRTNWGGYYHFGNSQLYVNTGLGMVGIPWRINMPGEITQIILKRSKID